MAETSAVTKAAQRVVSWDDWMVALKVNLWAEHWAARWAVSRAVKWVLSWAAWSAGRTVDLWVGRSVG